MPSFQTKWLFIGTHVLGGQVGCKSFVPTAPHARSHGRDMTLAGFISFLVLAIAGSHPAPAAEQQHCPWEAELGEHQHLQEATQKCQGSAGRECLAAACAQQTTPGSSGCSCALGTVGLMWGCPHLSTRHVPDVGGGKVVGCAQSHHRYILFFRMPSECGVGTKQRARV